MTYCTGKCGLKKDVIGISYKGYALGYKKCRECGIMYDTVGFASGALVCISGFVVLSIVSSYVGVGPWASALFICFRMSDLEILLKRQPEFSISSKDWYGNYDVMNCKYRRRLTGKYPELDGLFDVLVYFV